MEARTHRFTRRFPGALDAAFADEHFTRTLGQVRLGLALGIVL
jgi:hypothetical protein